MSLGYLIYVLIASGGNPHPDTYGFFVWVFIWAIAFDLKKMNAKLETGDYRRFQYREFEKTLNLAKRYPGDPNIVGTPTYLMKLGRRHRYH